MKIKHLSKTQKKSIFKNRKTDFHNFRYFCKIQILKITDSVSRFPTGFDLKKLRKKCSNKQRNLIVVRMQVWIPEVFEFVWISLQKSRKYLDSEVVNSFLFYRRNFLDFPSFFTEEFDSFIFPSFLTEEFGGCKFLPFLQRKF